MSDHPKWFAPKRYGIGSGLSISWQGWLVLIGYVVVLGLSSFLIRLSPAGFAIVAAILAFLFALIAARTTRGGWRWRWAEEE